MFTFGQVELEEIEASLTLFALRQGACPDFMFNSAR